MRSNAVQIYDRVEKRHFFLILWASVWKVCIKASALQQCTCKPVITFINIITNTTETFDNVINKLS